MDSKRIFIVEDERIVALDLQVRLARLGHKVVGNVALGDEALKQIGDAKVDIILTDIKLEGNIDGIQLAEAVHDRYGIPLIFVTAYSDAKTLARVKASNACGFILKPFTDEELQATIDIGLHEHDLEVKLKQSEEQYRSLFDDAPVGYHEIDLKGKLVRVNRTELEMLGYEAADMVGRPVWHFLEEGDTVRQDVFKKLRTGEINPRPFERNYLRRNGQAVPVLAKDYPIRSANGELLGIRSTIQDISVLKEEQSRLASFFAIAEKSTSGIVIANQKGIVRYVNPAAEELLGIRSLMQDISASKKEHSKQATLYAIVEKSTNEIAMAQKEFMRYVHSAIELILRRKEDNLPGDKSGVPTECETKEIDIVRAGDVRGTGEIRVTHTTWEGELAYLISIYDITDRKKVEEELKTLDKLKTEFISTVSHELRTPLSITKEGVSLILDRIPGAINENQSTILVAAKNNIDRLARIIDDLLDISKIESGKIELKREPLNIVDIVRQTVAGFKLRAEEKKLELRTDFSAKDITLYADHDKVIQIFTNLIGNALKFTKKGYIEISVKKLKDDIKCSVADTGIGISENDLPNVFNKFQQFTRVAGPGEKGTGLGLSIVKGLVEMHQGKINVESRLDSGTKFTFTFPKTQPKIFEILTADDTDNTDKKRGNIYP